MDVTRELLSHLEALGLGGSTLHATELGTLFVRPLVAAFDVHMACRSDDRPVFSKTI